MKKDDVFECLLEFAETTSSGYEIRHEKFGVVRLSPKGDNCVYVLSGSKAFEHAFKNDFTCRRQDGGGFVLVKRIQPQVAKWLLKICQSNRDAETESRRSRYNKSLAELKKKGTQIDAMVKMRVGQDVLRDELLQTRKCCELSGISHRGLLWVSHIKDWSESSDNERLDPENVLLLARNWDALFDKCFISFDSATGKMVKAKRIGNEELRKFGVPDDWMDTVKIAVKTDRRKSYLAWHNKRMEMLDDKANA